MTKLNYQKTFFYSIVIFAFFLPLSRASISLFVVLLPILWVLEGNFREKFEQIKSNKLLIAIFIYLSFNILSISWSQNISEALNIVRLNSYWLMIFVIATSIKKEQIQPIITSFLAGMFISEIIAYGVFFELWSFKNATVDNPSPVMFWIDYSVFMAFTSILLLNRILSKSYTIREKIILFLFFLTVTGNLFLAIGRTGQVALIVAIFVLSLIHFKFNFKSLLVSLTLIFTIFTAAYNISDTFNKRSNAALNDIKNISNMNLNGSWGIRVAYWITTYDIVKNEPLFGVGVGDFVDATKNILEKNEYPYLTQKTKEFMANFHPHNQFLAIVLQIGIIGLFIFLYLIYQLLKLKINNNELKELSILFVSIFFVSCFAEPLFFKQFTIGLFILFIGLFSVKDLDKN